MWERRRRSMKYLLTTPLLLFVILIENFLISRIFVKWKDGLSYSHEWLQDAGVRKDGSFFIKVTKNRFPFLVKFVSQKVREKKWC